MKSAFHSSKAKYVAAVIIVICGTCATALAADYANEDFSLRFPAALTRFANYGDVAGVGGASAGSKWSSSINPASTSWLNCPKVICVSTQYSNLSFDNGSDFRVPAESVTVNAGPVGFFTVAAAQVSTNNETLNDGLNFDFTADVAQLLWSKKPSEDWAIGLAFTYSKSALKYQYSGYDVVRANSDSYSLRGGTLHKITDKLLAGLAVEYGWSSDRGGYIGPPDVVVRDSTRQFLVRPGVSYEYMKDGTIYLDYQYGMFHNDTGTMAVHRILTGIEHGFTKWLFGRLGTTIDPVIGADSFTCGVGFYPLSWLGVDVAYQYDMFPEMREEFGRSQTFNVSLSVTY